MTKSQKIISSFCEAFCSKRARINCDLLLLSKSISFASMRTKIEQNLTNAMKTAPLNVYFNINGCNPLLFVLASALVYSPMRNVTGRWFPGSLKPRASIMLDRIHRKISNLLVKSLKLVIDYPDRV